MTYRVERPVCRRALLNLMRENDCTLEELLHHPTIFLSKGLRTQAKKMLEEAKIKTAKEIQQEKRKQQIRRWAGLIR